MNGYTKVELEDLKRKEKAEENYFLELRSKNAIVDWKKISLEEKMIADELAVQELSTGLNLRLKLKEERIDKFIDYANKFSVVVIVILCWLFSGLFAFLFIPIVFVSWYVQGLNQDFYLKKEKLSKEIFYGRRRHFFESKGLPYLFKDKSDIDYLMFGTD